MTLPDNVQEKNNQSTAGRIEVKQETPASLPSGERSRELPAANIGG
jgi:hypothetical protein